MCKTPRSDLAFSQVREDWQIEWQVLDLLEKRHSRPLRVLLVGSGGCTALSLLAHPGIERIDAVDANPAQLHLIILRQQALQHLSIDEQWLLLATADEAQAQARLAIYDRLHPNLPMATQHFWQERRQEIAYGVNQVGRFEQLFRSLAIAFEQAGLDPLNHPQEAVASPQWLGIFEQIFERERLIDLFGLAAVDYSMDRSFGEHFARVFAQASQRFVPKDNYFLTQVWADRYADSAEGRPAYLQAQYLPAIQANLSKLHLHLSQFAQKLQELATPYDLIQCSNISDWMPIPELQQMLELIHQSLNPGGAVIGRRLNGDHSLTEIMSGYFQVDRSLSTALLAQDRSFFYQEVVVGWREISTD